MSFMSNRYNESSHQAGSRHVQSWARAFGNKVWLFTVVTCDGTRIFIANEVSEAPWGQRPGEKYFSYTYHTAEVTRPEGSTYQSRSVIRCTCGEVQERRDAYAAKKWLHQHIKQHRSNGE